MCVFAWVLVIFLQRCPADDGFYAKVTKKDECRFCLNYNSGCLILKNIRHKFFSETCGLYKIMTASRLRDAVVMNVFMFAEENQRPPPSA